MFGKVATITVVGNEDGARVGCLPGYLAARIALHTGSEVPVATSSAYSVGTTESPCTDSKRTCAGYNAQAFRLGQGGVGLRRLPSRSSNSNVKVVWKRHCVGAMPTSDFV